MFFAALASGAPSSSSGAPAPLRPAGAAARGPEQLPLQDAGEAQADAGFEELFGGDHCVALAQRDVIVKSRHDRRSWQLLEMARDRKKIKKLNTELVQSHRESADARAGMEIVIAE